MVVNYPFQLGACIAFKRKTLKLTVTASLNILLRKSYLDVIVRWLIVRIDDSFSISPRKVVHCLQLNLSKKEESSLQNAFIHMICRKCQINFLQKKLRKPSTVKLTKRGVLCAASSCYILVAAFLPFVTFRQRVLNHFGHMFSSALLFFCCEYMCSLKATPPTNFMSDIFKYFGTWTVVPIILWKLQHRKHQILEVKVIRCVSTDEL